MRWHRPNVVFRIFFGNGDTLAMFPGSLEYRGWPTADNNVYLKIRVFKLIKVVRVWSNWLSVLVLLTKLVAMLTAYCRPTAAARWRAASTAA